MLWDSAVPSDYREKSLSNMVAAGNYPIAAAITILLYVGLRSVLILEEGEGRRILRPAFLTSCNLSGALRGLRNSPNL